MHEAERILRLECGCRQDCVTGIKTHLCDEHSKEEERRLRAERKVSAEHD